MLIRFLEAARQMFDDMANGYSYDQNGRRDNDCECGHKRTDHRPPSDNYGCTFCPCYHYSWVGKYDR